MSKKKLNDLKFQGINRQNLRNLAPGQTMVAKSTKRVASIVAGQLQNEMGEKIQVTERKAFLLDPVTGETITVALITREN